MNLITDRLLIRSLEIADAAQLAAIWSDADVTRYMGGPRDYQKTHRDLLSEIEQGEVDPADALWPVIEISSGRVVGDCGYIKKEVEGNTETEWISVFAKEAWGKGYATEAALALCRHAFQRLKLKRLIALIDHENRGSARVAEKCGFVF